MPDIVYHYTNAAGVQGILESATLWLTDLQFMNDAEELTFASTSVVADLRKRALNLWPHDTDDPSDGPDFNRAWMINQIIKYLAGPKATVHRLTTSTRSASVKKLTFLANGVVTAGKLVTLSVLTLAFSGNCAGPSVPRNRQGIRDWHECTMA